ncbi:MAG: class I SAM-dependent methyltransferase [Solirubrobacteraceae bacterium]
MDVHERLNEEELARGDYLAASHLHRYALAAELCAGLHVVDLACGVGYGTEMLAGTAASAHGVDIDEATIERAVATRTREGLRFTAADAEAFLRRAGREDVDVVVMFEGLEHVPNPGAVLDELDRLAKAGTRLIVSVPNSRAFRERNPFHVTDFGYAEAREAFRRFGEVTMLYQVFAEGSVILSEGADGVDFRGRVASLDYAEPEYANDFIAVVGFEPDGLTTVTSELNLVATPSHNRYMLDLERANAEYFRNNRQLARGIYGKHDAAAATVVARFERELYEERTRSEQLKRQLEETERTLHLEWAWRDAPRYHLADRLVGSVQRLPVIYPLAAWMWMRVRPRFSSRVGRRN